MSGGEATQDTVCRRELEEIKLQINDGKKLTGSFSGRWF